MDLLSLKALLIFRYNGIIYNHFPSNLILISAGTVSLFPPNFSPEIYNIIICFSSHDSFNLNQFYTKIVTA